MEYIFLNIEETSKTLWNFELGMKFFKLKKNITAKGLRYSDNLESSSSDNQKSEYFLILSGLDNGAKFGLSGGFE